MGEQYAQPPVGESPGVEITQRNAVVPLQITFDRPAVLGQKADEARYSPGLWPLISV